MGKNNTLYIVGNGFDLYHGLKTGYTSFRSFLEKNSPDSYLYLESYFDFSKDEDWRNFEKSLSKYNWELYFDEINTIDLEEDVKSKHFFGLEDEITEEIECTIELLKKSFSNWIESISYTNINKVEKIKFKEEAIFLSFNYTNTLEELYNIPKSNITYIHGRADGYEDLVFGHGELLTEVLENEGERSLCSDAYSKAKYPYYSFKKDTEKVVEENSVFFNSCSDITTVYVLGHSFGSVDLSYFRKIFEKCPKSEWIISYHNSHYCSDIITSMSSIGVRDNKIKLISEILCE